MVSELNKQLQFLQDQKAMTSLAQGNPDGFLDYAKERVKKMTGEELTLWNGLIRKAENKLDEEKWAAITKADDSKLEDFLDHLVDKFGEAPEGSSEAYSIIEAIDGVQKSIKARDQNALDQKALLKYIQDKDHLSYARYLATKLASTTDPSTVNRLRSDIETLQTRQVSDERV